MGALSVLLIGSTGWVMGMQRQRLKTDADALQLVASALPQDIFMPYTRLKSDPEVWHER